MIPEVFYTFEYDYDHNWRQTDTRLIMGGEVTTLTSMVYGEHEMLMSKKLHRIAGQQPWYALDYQYNIRGWLTGINTIDPSQPDNYFSMALYYENPPQVQGVDFQPQYNGNISAMQWHTATVEEVEGTNAYSFMYDELNRLTDAIFYHTDLNRQVTISQNGEMPQKHNEGLVTGIGSVGNIEYDKNGNILHVDRLFRQHSSNVKADLLDYTYDGNRLIAVDDQVIIPSELDDFRDNGYYYSQHGQAEYDYDFNGNMVFDLNREMKLQYGQLSNLPTLIGWRGGLIENQYTFDGQKLGKKVYDYRGNLTLSERYFDELLMQNGKVRRLQHADGYVSLTQSGAPAAYFYYLKDHLGNVRATLTHTPLTGLAVSQANDYYPFGMAYTPKLTGLQPESWNNKFKYNGKEEQEVPGGWLDYWARMYDPTLGRWHVVDPLADKYVDWSPYNYVGSNPIKRIDPDGMDWDIVIDHDQQSITVKANFTTFAGNDETVQASADTWNAQSGKFSYVVGKGDDAISYSVNFDISFNDGSSDASAGNSISVAPDDSKVFTDRARTEDGNDVTVGGLSDGESILMPESQKESVQKTSHEMGHNLGMGHTSGLMGEQGGKSLKGSSVNETLKHSGVKEKSKKDKSPNAKLRNKAEVGTAPNNFNNGTIQRNKDWEKKDFN